MPLAIAVLFYFLIRAPEQYLIERFDVVARMPMLAYGVLLALGALASYGISILLYRNIDQFKDEMNKEGGLIEKFDEKWTNHKFDMKLVNPANKRKHTLIVVGTGLAGASAAATLAELGYNVLSFCLQDTPRRAHSIAAQGGINAAKNYQNDGDSVYRLFYDTVKGGDYRAREANVYRLAQISSHIIDQCAAQGVPFAREYGGTLSNRSFGGAQVSRTFYARGQTGQQLLLGAYSALMRQVCLLYTSPSPRDGLLSRMPSSA